MQDISRQQYPSDNMMIRAEYEEEKRVFHLMKWLFIIIGSVSAVSIFLVLLFNTPAILAKTGAAGIPVLIPVFLFGTCVVGFWCGVIPSGYIGAWRALRRSGLFIFGNFLGMALILTLFACVPVLLSPIFFISQWVKVSNLKKQLEATA